MAADGACPKLTDGQERYRYLAAAIDPIQDIAGSEPPNFCPPIKARPRRLSATEIDTLILDPYAIYAKRVLELYPLGDLDPAPSPADRGRIVHAAFESFLQKYPDHLPDDVLAAILEAGDEAFAEFADHAEAQAFWRPAFERSARWAAEREIAHREDIALAKAHAELRGEVVFQAPGGPFKLTARADRIDASGDGVVDLAVGAPGIDTVYVLTLEAPPACGHPDRGSPRPGGACQCGRAGSLERRLASASVASTARSSSNC